MRVAIIFRPGSAAPIEAVPMLMGALGQWVGNYSKRFSTLGLSGTGVRHIFS